ncbi:hypothetical protein BUALT_BualtUnG0006100 [Buddleja alternifolia]|uniref:Zinc finger PMZ-type domain-containing protein n=1 Tax=Buddleja alternifolia TaxID=168488 RepID=A0AAV6W3T4_9LAMI|nr:hypothetical protein BUALT_BualtUnG0006100 [Buddleja alternifolia]
MHHSGVLCDSGRRVYSRGKIDYFEYCCVDEMSMIEVKSMAKEIGIDMDRVNFYYSRKHFNDCSDLIEMKSDCHAMELEKFLSVDRVVGIFLDNRLEKETSYSLPDISEGLGSFGDLGEHHEIDREEFHNEFDMGANVEEDGVTYDNEILDKDDTGFSDDEQSIGEDSVHYEKLEDSDNNATDDELDVDIDVKWGGSHSTVTEKQRDMHSGIEDLKGKFPVFNPRVDMEDPTFVIGLCFHDTPTFRDAIRQHSILNARDVVFTKNDKERVKVKCKHETCPWKLFASRIPGEDTMQVKTVHDIHECTRVEKVSAANSKCLANKYHDKLRTDLRWLVGSMMQVMQKDCKLLFSRYAAEIVRTNKNTTVKIKSKEEDGKLVFKRFYYCWGSLKTGFIEGCRPVICLDGRHFKTLCGGILLCAIGIDANNSLYPIAYVVVEKKKQSTWLWFLQLLLVDLSVPNDSGNNFKASHKGLALKVILWKAAKATRIVEFEKVLKDLKERDLETFKWLAKRPAAHWSKSYFSTFPKCDIMLNNLCESFNSMIVDSRSNQSLICELCPNIVTLLEENKKKSMEFIAHWNEHDQFELEGSFGDRFVLHLGEKTCSCRRWKLTGIPYAHAISDMYYMGYKPEDHVADCYKKQTFMRTYSHLMTPLHGPEEWPKSALPPLQPPIKENMPGRPKKQNKVKTPQEIEEEKANKAK